MHELNIGGRSKRVASSWNELSRVQLLEVVRIMHSGLSVAAMVAEYVWSLLDLKRDVRMAWAWLWLIGDDTKLDFSLMTEFLFEKPELTVNKLPVLRINRLFRKSILLYGPPDGLKRIKMLEFVLADKYCQEYHYAAKDGDDQTAIESLDRLVAILYRPKRSGITELNDTGDGRVVFNDAVVPQLMMFTKRLPKEVKLAVYLYYVSCRKVMISPYKKLFPQAEESDAENTREGTSETRRAANWVPAMYTIAESALKMEEVANNDARTVMYDLNQRIIKQEEWEAKNG